jgi:hypothetical protein
MPLEVYLQAGSTQSHQTITAIQDELSALMLSAGYQVKWATAESASTGGGASALAWVGFEGVCGQTGPTASGEPILADSSLGSAEVRGGRVLPFVTLHCDALNGLLHRRLARQPMGTREKQVGRAAARVIAHELYHVLTGSHEHTRSGLSKASFTANDLLSQEADFEPGAFRESWGRRSASSQTPIELIVSKGL